MRVAPYYDGSRCTVHCDIGGVYFAPAPVAARVLHANVRLFTSTRCKKRVSSGRASLDETFRDGVAKVCDVVSCETVMLLPSRFRQCHRELVVLPAHV